MPAHPNYPNGHMPAEVMVTVQTGLYQGRAYAIRLYGPVARAWAAEKAYLASAFGIVALIAPPAGGERTLATQADMLTHPSLYGLNPNSGAPLAPVGQSTHGWGTAVDVIPQAAVNALKASGAALARRFGFYFPLANDPNHTDRLDLVTATTGTTTPLGDDMSNADDVIKRIDDWFTNTIIVPGQGYGYPQALMNAVQAIQAGGVLYPGAQYNAFQALANQNASLLDSIQKLAGGQQVDVVQALKDSEARTAASFGAQLQAFEATLRTDLTASLTDTVKAIPGVQADQVEAIVEKGVTDVLQHAIGSLGQPATTTPTN